MKFIIAWLVTALAVAAAIWLVPGIQVFGTDNVALAIAIVSAVLALINMFIKPIVKVLSCPLVIITLGLFLLVVNAAMLELAAWASSSLFNMGITIDGFGSAVLGAIIISIVSMIANGIVNSNTRNTNNNYGGYNR